MSVNKLGSLLGAAGLLLFGFTNCVYLVDPGEKALIMNNLSGLKTAVYGQGFHLKIPFIEVPLV
jgi:uncharacterized protein YcgL (UPF0745 family)